MSECVVQSLQILFNSEGYHLLSGTQESRYWVDQKVNLGFSAIAYGKLEQTFWPPNIIRQNEDMETRALL